jgi:hypothetical protein
VSKRTSVPDGFERALTLADAVKAARAQVSEKEAAIATKEADLEKDRADLVKLRADLGKVERRFQDLILSAAHADPKGEDDLSPTPEAEKAADEAFPRNALPSDIPWAKLPKKLQLAWIIFEEGVLDYRDAAMRIYSMPNAKGKARVNALMTSLRDESVVGPSQGQRRYSLIIDRDELLRRSYAYVGVTMP